MRNIVLGMIALCLQSIGAQQVTSEIRRLPPSDFAGLPISLRAKLAEMGCTVPQSFADSKPHNVIRAEFAKKGQTDYAALCSRKGASAIVVFWGGPAQCKESEIERGADSNWLQGTASNRMEYSRKLGVADAKSIRRYHSAFGSEQKLPKLLDHSGIDDVFLEKASVILYCHQGEWLRLQGAD